MLNNIGGNRMSTRPNQFGINRIFTAETVSESTVISILEKTLEKHRINATYIEKLDEYYKGNQYDNITSSGRNIDEKNVVNLTKVFIDTVVSITLNKEITYVAREDIFKDDVEKIANYMRDEDEHTINLDTCTNMVVDGIGYQYCLQNGENDITPHSPFTIGLFSPKDTYLVQSLDIGNPVVLSVHISEYDDIKQYACFDNKYKYIIKNSKKSGKLEVTETTLHDLPFNPIQCYNNDMYRLSAVADLMGLQDSLNTSISNYNNDVLIKINQILVIIGAELAPEEAKKLKESGVLQITGKDGVKQDVKFVSSQLDSRIIDFVKNTVEMMCLVSGCPSQNAGSLETGKAVETANGHTIANFVSNRKEQAFHKPKRQQLDNIIAILKRKKEISSNIKASDIDIKFDKNRLTSISDNVINLVKLLDAGMEEYDALVVCPFIDDISSVADRIKENRERMGLKTGKTEEVIV